MSDRINALHVEIADHDHSDYTGLAALTERLRTLKRNTPNWRTNAGARTVGD